jgi:hypothetical protein
MLLLPVVLAFSEWNAILQVINYLLSCRKGAWSFMGWDMKSPHKQPIGCSCTGCRMLRGESCFLENYVSTDDWQCRYIQGKCSYIYRTKPGRKHVPYGELVGTREYLTL